MNEAAGPVVSCPVKTLGLVFYTFSTAETVQSERSGVCVGIGSAKQPPAEKKISDEAVVDCVSDPFVELMWRLMRSVDARILSVPGSKTNCALQFSISFVINFFILG